jgi:putative ABC transport system permease protein
MKLWTCSVREIQRRPLRLVLTLAGITLGLAAVVATRLTIHTVDRAYRQLFEGIAGRTALEITARGQGGFAADVAARLERVPGVQAVVPSIQGAAALVGPAGSVAVPVVGIDPGRAIGDREALLDASLAQSLNLAAGQTLQLWTAAGPTQLHLAGIVGPRPGSAAVGGQLVVSLACAQRLFALAGRVNSIQVLLSEDADPADVLSRIAPLLPAGLVVQPPGMHGARARSTLLAAEQGLASLSIVAVVAAGFVILNTFLLSLGERRKQLALLRSLGASRAQVLRLVVREAVVLGVAGTVAGCGLGVVLAAGLNGAMQQLLGIPLPRLQLSAGPFVLAAVLGPITTLAAACLPAWRASRRPPLAELLPGQGHSEELLPPRLWRLGLVLLAAGLLVQLGLGSGRLETLGHALLVPSLALILVGSVLALPLVVDPLLRLVGILPLGLEGQLASGQLQRHRGRTSLTSGVLFLAVVVAIAFGQSLETTLGDLRHWYRQTIVADYLVRGAMPDTSFLLTPALPEPLAEEIGACPSVAAVDRIAFVPADVADRPVLVLARTFAEGRPLPLDLHEGTEADVRAGLLAGEVVLGTGLAQRLGLHRGDALSLTTARGPRSLRIAGTAAEYAGGGQALYLKWQAARRLFELPGVHVFLVSARPGEVAALGEVLGRFCTRHHLLLQSNAELRERIDAMVGQVTGVLWGLMALAFAVASLGIVNTLTMNVHEQTRQLGLLRALGLTRAQLRRMVTAQAVLLASISLLPGVLVGVALAWAIHHASSAWAGPQAAFHLHGLVVAGCCILAVVMAILAALVPARRAARLSVIQALQHS